MGQGMSIGVTGKRLALADADVAERFGQGGEAKKESMEERR
jgi:hypothetical protein